MNQGSKDRQIRGQTGPTWFKICKFILVLVRSKIFQILFVLARFGPRSSNLALFFSSPVLNFQIFGPGPVDFGPWIPDMNQIIWFTSFGA